MKISARRRSGAGPTEQHPPPAPPEETTSHFPGPDSAEIGGDELRARAYLRTALGETGAPAAQPPAWWSTHSPDQQQEPQGTTSRVEVHHHHHYAPPAEPAASTSASGGERLFDFSWITADKPRLVAVAAGALAQPALYTFATEAGRLAPVGAVFMAGLVTGFWRLRYGGPLTRWLFTLNLSTGALYLPTFLLIVTVLTGVPS